MSVEVFGSSCVMVPSLDILSRREKNVIPDLGVLAVGLVRVSAA